MAKPRVIVVSNRLPVHITEEAGQLVLHRSVGGLATALGSVMTNYPMLWIGWAGAKKKLTKKQLIKLQFPEQLIPVPISSRLLNRYYNRLANGVLWPAMHGMRPVRLSQKADWKATNEVTMRFAAAIQENRKPDDIIWIHDYHLVLLPKLLRDQGIKNRIGFFLHTPFPAVDTFFMKWRHHREILESLSNVDLLGLQTERDVKNFRACLSQEKVRMRRGASIKAIPIGIDFKSYRAATKVGAVGKYLSRLQTKLTGKKVILSVSRLDYTKGIIEQLQAVEIALDSYKPGKIIYRLVVAPSREAIDEYHKLKLEIESTVQEINKRFKKKHKIAPIKFEYRSHGFEELSAWYRMTDVLLVTPLIDGMNLVVKEYIAARGDNPGAAVLSETIGAAFQLKDAIQVDPLDTNEIAWGLLQALIMPAPEKKRRWQTLRGNVRKEDVFWWTNSFLTTLAQTAEKQDQNIEKS